MMLAAELTMMTVAEILQRHIGLVMAPQMKVAAA
jgi:hypothetical protein